MIRLDSRRPWPVTLALSALPLLAAAQDEAQDEAPPIQGADGMSQAELEALSERIRGQVAELRGQEYLRPVAVAVTDAEGFFAYAKERLDESTTPAELAALEDATKLLGVLPPDMDYIGTTMEILQEQVGGFYDPSQDKFFLMSSFGGDLAKVILAHELTHALDDQLYDIDGQLEARKGNSDAAFAFQAVVEGSGTAVMNRWTLAHLGELDPKELAKSGDIGMESMKTAPPYLWKPLLGAYFKGAAFLARTESVMQGQMASLAPEDIHSAFTDPPRSSEQILHPEKYWDPEQRDDPVQVSVALGDLPEGWALIGDDTLGEMGLAFAVEPLKKRKGLSGQMAALTTSYTNDAAEGWDGDRYAVLGKGDARVLVLSTVWDSAEDAEEFRQALASFEEYLDDAAAGLAVYRHVEGSGHALHAEGTRVRFESWVGAAGDELAAVLAAVRFEVALPPARDASGG